MAQRGGEDERAQLRRELRRLGLAAVFFAVCLAAVAGVSGIYH